MMRHARPKSLQRLSFEYKILDDWYKASLKTKFVDGVGSRAWVDFLVQSIDYMVNPSVIMKN